MAKKDGRTYPITVEKANGSDNVIRASAFYPYKDNDRFHFAATGLDELQSLIERFTEHNLKVVNEGEKLFFVQEY